MRDHDGEDEDGFYCINCGSEAIRDDQALCEECQQEEAELRWLDEVDARAKGELYSEGEER